MPIWAEVLIGLSAGIVVVSFIAWIVLTYCFRRFDDTDLVLRALSVGALTPNEVRSLSDLFGYPPTPLLYHGEDEPEHECVWQPWDACLQRERCIYRCICEMQFKRSLGVE
jgi:hypothetical protein